MGRSDGKIRRNVGYIARCKQLEEDAWNGNDTKKKEREVMTEKEIRAIVECTVDELLNRDLLKEDGNLNYQFMSAKLEEYFKKPRSERIKRALDNIRDDPYYKIIPEYYKFHRTLTWIAVDRQCDRVTIARNKKRLVLELYKMCYG